MKHGASQGCIKSVKASATREAAPCHVGNSLITSIITQGRQMEAALPSRLQTVLHFHIQLVLKASSTAHLHLFAFLTHAGFKSVSSAQSGSVPVRQDKAALSLSAVVCKSCFEGEKKQAINSPAQNYAVAY